MRVKQCQTGKPLKCSVNVFNVTMKNCQLLVILVPPVDHSGPTPAPADLY